MSKPRKLTKSDIGKVFWIHGNNPAGKLQCGILTKFDEDNDPMFTHISGEHKYYINESDGYIHCFNDGSHIEKTD